MSEPDRPPPPLVVTLAALTVVSGFVDAVSFLGLGHVFTANMTGNVVLIGFAAAGAPGFSMAASLCALGGFLAGAVVGGRIVRSGRRAAEPAPGRDGDRGGLHRLRQRSSPARSRPSAAGWPRFTVIALLAVGMGTRNAAVRHIGVPDMSTTVLTTTLTGLASGSRLAGGQQPARATRPDVGRVPVRRGARRRPPRAARRGDLVARRRRRHRRRRGRVLLPGGPGRARTRAVAGAGVGRSVVGTQTGRPSSR